MTFLSHRPNWRIEMNNLTDLLKLLSAHRDAVLRDTDVNEWKDVFTFSFRFEFDSLFSATQAMMTVDQHANWSSSLNATDATLFGESVHVTFSFEQN